MTICQLPRDLYSVVLQQTKVVVKIVFVLITQDNSLLWSCLIESKPALTIFTLVDITAKPVLLFLKLHGICVFYSSYSN